jgi:PKHD-type hydroxylase
MLLVLKNVLDAQQLKAVRTLLDRAEFVDGKLSAGSEAVKVKQNEEVKTGDVTIDHLNQLVMSGLLKHAGYQSAALPLRIAVPFYARYTQGMQYGHHVDDPVMGPMNGRYRSDISTTVFLNGPDEYEGGELVISTSFGDQVVKLDAGDAVVYPSSSWHSVREVKSGVRLVAVTWAQSMVRDSAQRELLYELGQARDQLLQAQPQAQTTGKVSTCYVNLLRMWSEL